MQKRLGESVDIVWEDDTLRRALESFSHNKEIAILIDRRVEPGQKIQITLHQATVKEAFETIARNCGLGFSLFGPVAYFAPPDVAGRVRTLAALREEEVRRLSPEAVKKFFQRRPIVWDDLATPRDLLQKLANESSIEIVGLDQIPHDLWAAADLPPLDPIEWLTLIANQFDLTFHVSADGKRIILQPIPNHVELVRTYSAGSQPEEMTKKYAALVPQARIRVVGDKIEVVGLIEDHERIMAPPRPIVPRADKAADVDPALKRYTLTVKEKPLGPLLKQLAAQLNLELKMDEKALEQAGVSLQQRVSFSVKDATLDELLQAVIAQTPLKFVRRENVIQIETSSERRSLLK